MSLHFAWHRVTDLAERNVAEWLGIEHALLAQVRNRYGLGYQIERFAESPRHNGTEIRIPCKVGEIYPVKPDWWAWSGLPGNRYKRIRAAAGPTATGPFGGDLEPSPCRDDEAVIWFEDSAFGAVARTVKAKRRNRNWQGGAVAADRNAA